MIYSVHISREAEEDLRGIYAYIAFNLLSLKNAQGQINRLEEAILSLDEFPLAHRLVSFEPWRSRGLRFMACDNFLIFILFLKKSMKLWFLVCFMGKEILRKL
ncbi:type II toxin-antitoxin system RelE/ParE family toxin [Gardnerella greenwoodii]|uniref:type II toxin-antitoxin system RelE/ParE family toxin n=1 Tax=Gardnerella greenwoodii TaxID=2914925 RepID=UPI0020D21BEE|nr:type II toxin-antitoxin system RelE/ParE family toxin [Gardnerella greenwoodii]